MYLGHEVAILSATHEIAGPDQRAGHTIGRPVTVERGAWIGARATMLGGVTIGAGSIVAAGAVVARSTKPNTVVGGVPARELRELRLTASVFAWDRCAIPGVVRIANA